MKPSMQPSQDFSRHHAILMNLLMLALGLICGLVIFLAFNRPTVLEILKFGPAPVPASQEPEVEVKVKN